MHLDGFSSWVAAVVLLPSACVLLYLSYQLRNIEFTGRNTAKIKGSLLISTCYWKQEWSLCFVLKFPLRACYLETRLKKSNASLCNCIDTPQQTNTSLQPTCFITKKPLPSRVQTAPSGLHMCRLLQLQDPFQCQCFHSPSPCKTAPEPLQQLPGRNRQKQLWLLRL